MSVEQVDVLRKIDTKLGALLAIAIDDLLRKTPELANPRVRSVDQMLNDVGLTQGEIAALLGKTPQAVSQQLSKKPAKKAAKKTTSGGA